MQFDATLEGVVQGFDLKLWREQSKTSFNLKTQDEQVFICKRPGPVDFELRDGHRVRVSGDWLNGWPNTRHLSVAHLKLIE